MPQFESSEALCEYVAGITEGRALLSFSCGKDSIGAWLQMRRHFKEIVPVFMYLVPGLSFVDEALAYYEDYFETRIIRLPHPSLYRMLNNLTYQAPENIREIESRQLWEFDYDNVMELVRMHRSLPLNTYCGNGVRAVDSPARWAAIKQYGPLNEKQLKFYPIYDWRKDRLLSEISGAGIRLGQEYLLFGRTFDGIDYRFLKPIKDRHPEDYAKILEWFPLAEMVIKKMEYREAYIRRGGVCNG